MAGSDDDPVVFVPALAGRVLGFVSPLILFGIVALARSTSGRVSWIGWVLGSLGVVMLASALFDQPRRIVFTPDGVLRCCVLRTRLYSWSEISSLTRLPQKRRATDMVSRSLVGSQERSDNTVGLMARIGTKRVMLMDKNERVDQWEQMTARVRRWSPGCGLPPRPAGGY